MNLSAGILAVDVGSGTQDILVWRPDLGMSNCPKLVLPSATSILAGRILEATGAGRAIYLSGRTMGGGPCSAAIRRHLKAGFRVLAQPAAALTLHDDLERVQALGVEIVDRAPAEAQALELSMGDLDLEAIGRALAIFRVPMPQRVAVAVQDHGFSPRQSNRAFRFEQWRRMLASGRGLDELLYCPPPEHLTRMRAVSESAPGAWLMDTGAAAILGALLDPWVAARRQAGLTLVNAGNEHTVAALVRGAAVYGIYEHHTSLLEPAKLADHLLRFRREKLSNAEVFDDQGHGCQVLPGTGLAGDFAGLALTGPNRERFAELGGHMAAPFGDMMMTGCFGLLEAVSRRVRGHGIQGPGPA